MSTTPIALAGLDGGGKPITLRADQAADNSVAMRASLEVGGAAVGQGNAVPVADAAVLAAVQALTSQDAGLATAAGQASALTQQTAAAAALGTPADVAWGGTGSTTNIGALKALWAALTGTLKVALQAGTAVIGKVGLQVGGADVAQANPLPTADANGAAFQGVVAITPGTPVTAARSLGYVCTSAGNVTLTLADTSTITLALVASSALQTLPFAVTSVALGSGTAGTFWNLK